VRVIDSFPSRLEDFSRASNGFDDASEDGSDIDMVSPDLPSWKWDFFLLVEEAKRPATLAKGQETPNIWVHVPNEAAQFLLKLDASDLTQDRKGLAQLRERLCILWGNLEELKSAANEMSASIVENDPIHDPWNGALSNVAFECCIQEYGQKIDRAVGDQDGVDEWVRIYQMFGVTII